MYQIFSIFTSSNWDHKVLNRAMKKINLHEKFIEALNYKISRRSELVAKVADVLKIERESASRRISGRVQFSIFEMGILAKEMKISLDAVLYQGGDYYSIPVRMDFPGMLHTLDGLVDLIESYVMKMDNTNDGKTELGVIFDSLPIEFYFPHHHLCRFMFFKWGHYFVKSEEFRTFTNWQLPGRLIQQGEKIMNLYQEYDTVFYIWDLSTIRNLANDLKFFGSIYAISKEDADLIKDDIHNMLSNLENVAKGVKKDSKQPDTIDFYITTVDIGMSCFYHLSQNNWASNIRTYFLHTPLLGDYDTCQKIREWVHSMKNVSTLISGGGEKERRTFFEEQHRIIDEISA